MTSGINRGKLISKARNLKRGIPLKVKVISKVPIPPSPVVKWGIKQLVNQRVLELVGPVTATVSMIAAQIIYNNYDRIVGYLLGEDSIQTEKKNLQQLKRLNQETGPIVSDYEKICDTLKLLCAKFSQDEKGTLRDLEVIRGALMSRDEQVSSLNEPLQKLDFGKFHTLLDELVNNFDESVVTHGEKLLDFAPVVKDLEEAEIRLQQSKDRLKKAQEAFNQVTKEIKEVAELIIKARKQKQDPQFFMEKSILSFGEED